jgi:peptidoglycan/xylan/chitin deacetylase (PgdA/CDA1 family)
VALTFDDGPDPVWTPKVLEQLRKAKVKATFCVIGSRARRYPELMARIAEEGHQLCNHSWNHDMDLGRRSTAAIRADLRRTSAAIRAAVPDAKIPFYRQPGGRWSAEVVAVAKELGMRSLHWTVDPQDWAKPKGATIAKRISTAARPGAVVLLHDGGGDRSTTLAACPAVIKDLKRRYGIVKLR